MQKIKILYNIFILLIPIVSMFFLINKYIIANRIPEIKIQKSYNNEYLDKINDELNAKKDLNALKIKSK